MSEGLETTIKLVESQSDGEIRMKRGTSLIYNTKIQGTNPTFMDYCVGKTKVIGSPPARWGHFAAQDGNTLYVFGGLTTGGIYLNDMWKFNIDTGLWTPLAPTNSTPSIRAFGISFIYQNNFYIHGGTNGSTVLSDFYKFDTELNKWYILTTTGTNYARYNHSCAILGDSVYICGGNTTAGLDTTSTVTFKLNLLDNTLLNQTVLPFAASNGIVFIYNNFIFHLYGFNSTGAQVNNIYRGGFDASGNISTWSTVTFTNTNNIGPTSRGYFSFIQMTADDYRLYGGTLLKTETSSIADQVIDRVFKLTMNPFTNVGTWILINDNTIVDEKRKGATAFKNSQDEIFIYGGARDFPAPAEIYDNIIGLLDSQKREIAPATFPEARWGHYGKEIGNFFYIFGGCNSSNVYLNDTWKFDMIQETWTQIFPVLAPSIRGFGTSFAYNNELYIHGGTDGTTVFSNLFKFDTVNENWISITITGTNLARCNHASAVLGNLVYICCGTNDAAGTSSVNNCFSVNLSTFVGTTQISVLTSRSNGTAYIFNNYMYYFFGYSAAGTRVASIVRSLINTTTGVLGSWGNATFTGAAPTVGGNYSFVEMLPGFVIFYGGSERRAETSTRPTIDTLTSFVINPATNTGIWTTLNISTLGTDQMRRGAIGFKNTDNEICIHGGMKTFPVVATTYSNIWKLYPNIVCPYIQTEKEILTYSPPINSATFTYKEYSFECISITGVIWIKIYISKKSKDQLMLHSLRINIS